MIVEYNSNNSGRDWWLSTKQWLKLERAGWTVIWGGDYFCQSRYNFARAPDGKPQPCANNDVCPGHQRFDSYKEMTQKDAWLGCYARKAYKEFPTIEDAIAEWESVVGMSASGPGCSCCGQPRNFYEKSLPEKVKNTIGRMIDKKLTKTRKTTKKLTTKKSTKAAKKGTR